MNKKLLALAIGTAVMLPVSAIANPTLYGKMNVTLENVDNGTTDVWQLNSNASRLGVKGEAAINDTLKGIYQAEYQIDVDDGATPFSQRNIFAGLKGDFGTLRFGKMDTPLKDAQGKVDQFNDLNGDIQNVMSGESRADNSTYYSSPKLLDGALTLNAAVIQAENTVDLDGDGTTDKGLGSSVSVSGVYEKDALYLALAYHQNVVHNGGARNVGGYSPDGATGGDVLRFVVGYKMDALELGFILNTLEDNATGSSLADQSMMVSGAYTTGDWKLKAQYGTAEADVGTNERTLAAIGADYKLSKQSKLFGYYSTRETDPAGAEFNTLALGLEHNF